LPQTKRIGVTHKTIVTFLTALLLSSSAWAGLGKISVRSHLGEPFRAVVSLTDVPSLTQGRMHIGLADRKTFDDLNVDYEPVLSGLQFSLESGPQGPVIAIRSVFPIRSSYLRFVLELKTPIGRWVRDYTVLLDTPNVNVAGEGDAVPVPADSAVATRRGPVRGAAAAQPPQPATIKVPRGGTLPALASKVRPAAISLNRVMASLFQSNQDKFVNRDPMRLKSGAVLRVPSIAAMRAMSEAHARALLHPGVAVAPSLAVAPAGHVKAPLHLPQAPAPVPEVAKASALPPMVASAPHASAALQIASAPAASDAAAAVEKIKALQQQVDARAHDLSSANQHINDLKLKIKALEASQAQAAIAKNQSWFSVKGRLKWLAMAVGAVVLLLVLLLLLRRRRKKGGTAKPAAARHPLATTGVAPPAPVPGVTGDGDPLAEAEVYLAYGHEEQAEAILRQGLELDPARQDIRAKLLEIYAARPDPLRFEGVAREVHDAYDGRGAQWERTRAMGLTIDADNPLYQPGSLPDSDMLVASTEEASNKIEDSAELGAMLDFSMEDPVASEPEPALDAVAVPADKDALLDFDFSLDSPAAAPEVAAEPSVPDQLAAPAAVGGVSEQAEPQLSESDQALQAMGFGGEDAPVLEAPPALPVEDASALPDVAEPALQVEVIDHGDPVATDSALDDALATKLDLARVYLDMGDSEGAREVLLELQKEAQGALKQQAEDMLAQLAGQLNKV
jgi:pilus assembly protein FimV